MLEDTPLIEMEDEIRQQDQKRRGPPNRMNDLAYRDWMKFQKSFFWGKSSQTLVEECIYFFSKSVWPNGSSSRCLIVGVEDFDARSIPLPRVVDTGENCSTLAAVERSLTSYSDSGEQYDFVLVDLRHHICDVESLVTFLTSYADNTFKTIRKLLAPSRYCAVIVGYENKGGSGFPLPWAVAYACRDHLRLRDEKIGLVEPQGSVFYCLIMQAENDERPAQYLLPQALHFESDPRIPAWLIPRPPPRKKNEVLHPAKYPETLVTEFIELFSKPGDRILDPMVGTGSTVVAALRSGRHGYGIDLNPEFVEIANQRIDDERRPMLFRDMEHSSQTLVIQGDATRLSEINRLSEIGFDYVITSPPYWSMLTNPGSEYQEQRRKKNLRLTYSELERDIGNIADYESFLDLLVAVYNQVASKLVTGGCLTVVVKNIKRNHVVYPLAWDLAFRLCGANDRYTFIGTTLWCQDDVGIKPFAVGTHWVSNTLHHYCIHFKKRK